MRYLFGLTRSGVASCWLVPALLFSLATPTSAAEAPDGTLAHEQTVSRIAFGSCAKQSVPQPIWQEVLERQPDLFVWAGDNIYGDTDDMSVMRSKYEQLKAVPGYARLLKRGVKVLGTWDDHDYGRNDAGREYEMRQASQQVFLDFFGVAKDSVRRSREGVYHAETFGKPGNRVQVILLDTRYHRSPLQRFQPAEAERQGPFRPAKDPAATMLGQAQWSWLESQLRKPADVRLIVSSVQVIPSEHRYEKWINIPRERSRLLRLIQDTQAQGVVLLSGDRHHAELSRLEPSRRSSGYPLYELTSSGLTQSKARPGPNLEPNPHRVGRVYRGNHFGEVAIDWSQPDPTITLSIIDLQGKAVIQEPIQLSELKMPVYDDEDRRFVPVEQLPAGSALLSDEPRRDRTGSREAELTLDGDVSDWTTPGFVHVDEHYIYLRFTTGDQRTLRRHPERVTIGLDLDADSSTGETSAHPLRGSDVKIEISPESRSGQRRRHGPSVTVITDSGAIEMESQAYAINLAPTYASSWFEVRLSRTCTDEKLNELLGQASEAAVKVIGKHRDTGATRVLASDRFTMPKSRKSTLKQAKIPQKADGAVRVVSINVLWATPQQTPKPFERLFKTIDADIYLIQEWDRYRYSEREIQQWFSDHVDADATWSAMVTGSGSNGAGTAVVSKHPMTAKLPGLTPVVGGRWDFPARTAAAVVEAPAGRFLVGSVHFKAGGNLGSSEDLRRYQEAEAVNYLMKGMAAASKPDVVVLGGDFNLNGSTQIVRAATQGLDLDRSALEVLSPGVLGDRALLYTHGRGSSKNRLDYLTYSASSATVSEAFVLDSTILDRPSLQRLRLQATDSHASDHLPVVVDFKTIK